jgi:chemosensory pili system protein ChpA (sensor histidine kinase/response regulator)
MKACSIMVVDESDFVRKVTADILTEEGYSVVTASNGIDALMNKDFEKMNIILMALEMPFLNGFETARLIRNRLGMLDSPIIIGCSEYEISPEKARSFGINEIQYKSSPFKKLFLNTIKKWENFQMKNALLENLG